MAGVQRRRRAAGSAPHCVNAGGNRQGTAAAARLRAGAKRATQASHTGCAGQARQTAHWPGSGGRESPFDQVAAASAQYTRAPHAMSRPTPAHHRPHGGRAHGTRVAPARSPWLHEEVGAPHGRPAAMDPARAARPGPTGSRCAAACEAHALVERRYRRAECFVIESQRTAPRRAQAGMAPRPWWRPAGRRPHAHHRPPAGRRRPDALGQHGAAHGGRSAGADRAVASRARDRRLPDVLLPGPGHLARTAGAVRARSAGRRRPRLHRHARLGRHAGARRLRRAGDGHGAHHADLGNAGARCWRNCANSGANLHPGALPGLARPRLAQRAGRRRWRELAARPTTAGWRLTFEIIYGHAFKPAPRVRMSEQSAVSLRDMRAMLQRAGQAPRDQLRSGAA